MEPFLNTIALTQTLPCLAEPGKIVVRGRPSRPLDEVIPYLATLPNIISFNPVTLTLTFRRRPGFLTLYPDKVYITQVKDLDEGLMLLGALVEAINTTWEHRNELVAVTTAQHAQRPMDVWTLLPRTNCGQCGDATCMAFAFNLLLQKRDLTECLALQTDEAYADRRAALMALI